MITDRRVLVLKPGEWIETCRVGNVRAVVTRGKDGLIHWFREELDDAGQVLKRERTVRSPGQRRKGAKKGKK